MSISNCLLNSGVVHGVYNCSVGCPESNLRFWLQPKNLWFLHCSVQNVKKCATGIISLIGTIRATVMVETLLAAVNMEEMLYEIRDHCCGMNAGRWDYIFSAIKRLQKKPDAILPDRKDVNIFVCWEP